MPAPTAMPPLASPNQQSERSLKLPRVVIAGIRGGCQDMPFSSHSPMRAGARAASGDVPKPPKPFPHPVPRPGPSEPPPLPVPDPRPTPPIPPTPTAGCGGYAVMWLSDPSSALVFIGPRVGQARGALMVVGRFNMIRKLSSGKYRLYSRKRDAKTGRRRNLGTFKTRGAAEQHEREVQFFKHRG